MEHVACTRCRGDFELEVLEEVAVCPYCGEVQELAPEVVQRARDYGAKVESEVDRASLERLIAARSDALAPTAWTGVVVWAATMAVTVAGLVSVFFAGVVPVSVEVLAGLGIVIVASTALTLRPAKARSAAGDVTRFDCSCPACGGQNTLAVGQTLATCEYCDAALVPGERVAAIGLGLARAATRAAKLAAVAAKRRYGIVAESRNRTFSILAAVAGPIVPAIVTAALYGQYRAGTGQLADFTVGAVATALLVVAPFIIRTARRVLDADIGRAMDLLANRPASSELSGVRGTLAWLNELWPDEYGTYYDLQPGARYRAVATVVRGFPVLVAVRPGRYLHIAVATTPAADKIKAKSLNEQGFQLTVSESGVLASLRGKPLSSFDRPSEHLGPAVDALVEAIARAGGRPRGRGC